MSSESGQAMAEYAIVVFALVAGLLGFIPMFISALQRYYDSFYVLLSLPVP